MKEIINIINGCAHVLHAIDSTTSIMEVRSAVKISTDVDYEDINPNELCDFMGRQVEGVKFTFDSGHYNRIYWWVDLRKAEETLPRVKEAFRKLEHFKKAYKGEV